jgi:PEP-CTERM motif-containing protein
MTHKNALRTFLVLNAMTAFAATAAHAELLTHQGFECGSASPTVFAGSAPSLCDWYQWANSGPVVTTVQSMSNLLEGGSSAHGSGNAGDGAYQYGFFGPGFFISSAWFNVQSGGASIGLYDNGGTQGSQDQSIHSPYGSSTGCNPNGAPAAVPEPGTFVLMGLGLLGLAYGLRRRSAQAQ